MPVFLSMDQIVRQWMVVGVNLKNNVWEEKKKKHQSICAVKDNDQSIGIKTWKQRWETQKQTYQHLPRSVHVWRGMGSHAWPQFPTSKSSVAAGHVRLLL
jgi:hypothetical protein